MPAAVRIEMTDKHQTAVEERFEQTRDAETRLRYQMVLLANDGYTAPQIASVVRRSADTVLRVLRRYQDVGIDGVPYRARPGRPTQVPPAWEAELRRVIEVDPHMVGVPRATWTTQLLSDYLEQVTGHRTGIETVRMHLHAADYVCKRPTWTLQRKAQEQEDWAKNA